MWVATSPVPDAPTPLRSTAWPVFPPDGSMAVASPASRAAAKQAVGALRAKATDVDTTRMSREEWRKKNDAAGIGTFSASSG